MWGWLYKAQRKYNQVDDLSHAHSQLHMMKATIPTILLGMLSLSTSAFAYLDHNKLDARDSPNSPLIGRGNTVEVPFHPSLRPFLEKGADAHYRRTLPGHEDKVSVVIHPLYKGEQEGKTMYGLAPKSWTAEAARARLLPGRRGATCKFYLGAVYNAELLSLEGVSRGAIIILDCHP
ncbi:hypothetical protein DFP72DRAFT_862615 [Ephemerocybe angulata]|uniref:Uncharacterized protein n=1 Tax=Ephemerocybe angulata TaxID=980116 RepID=A0A8H6H6I3_9AGAR|nr:hypothetical protein DFP72DRAFT_862615 [Tulosesus angulatus]